MISRASRSKPGDHVGNLLRYREFQNDESWSRLGKPVERWRWGFTPQTVNASYSATNNEITFPAGILQPPFFNLDADDAINYGAIGAVIGHEISHGFDDQGRKSDGDGNLRDWWTADDAKKFEERATKLGAQFESYTPLPGMKINGRQTMGENIGDLSGIAVALSRLQDLAQRQAGAGHRRLHRRSALLPRLRADLALQVARRGAAESAAHRRAFTWLLSRLRAAHEHRRVLHRVQPQARRQAVSGAGGQSQDLVDARFRAT